MAGALKKKHQAAELPAKKLRKGKHARVQRRETVPQIDELLEAWKGEVVSLESREFATEEDAIATVISQVVQRVNLPAHLIAPTREFLVDLFGTDPELRAELCGCLRIRKQARKTRRE